MATTLHDAPAPAPAPEIDEIEDAAAPNDFVTGAFAGIVVVGIVFTLC